jgi:hypothetical protein
MGSHTNCNLFLSYTSNTNIAQLGVFGGTNSLNIASSFIGINTTSPSATLDVNGTCLLRNGNSIGAFSNNQILFGWAGGSNYLHAIKSRHNSSANNTENAIDFYVWQTTDSATSVGSKHVMSVTSAGVGINTTSPSSTLSVNGSLSKSSGSFDIPHPVCGPTKRLVHSFIEGPRADLIYRGRTSLSNGQAVINLNRECTGNGSIMTDGTFEELCRDPEVFVQNNESWDKVRGWVNGCLLHIECENPNSYNNISWMVIAERKDPSVKEWNLTDTNGQLILEYDV